MCNVMCDVAWTDMWAALNFGSLMIWAGKGCNACLISEELLRQASVKMQHSNRQNETMKWPS